MCQLSSSSTSNRLVSLQGTEVKARIRQNQKLHVQVGGLRDTVKPYNPYENSGTGWTFDWADAGNFRDAIGNALYTFREFRDSFEGIQKRGMQQDLSWDNAAEKYEEMLLAAKYQW